MRNICGLLVVALTAGMLISCDLTAGFDCNCITRHASGAKGAALDTWVNFDVPSTGAPEGFTGQVAFAELTFLSIKGQQGVQVNVCNQHRQLTAIEIDNLGPELFAVPPGCTIQIRCARRESVNGGCEVNYRFRWLHK